MYNYLQLLLIVRIHNACCCYCTATLWKLDTPDTVTLNDRQ